MRLREHYHIIPLIYDKLLKNSVESYPLRDKIAFVIKDVAWVEQALAKGSSCKSLRSNAS